MTPVNVGQIYCIKNTSNDKMYIGQTMKYRKAGKYTRNFGYEKRFLEHKNQTISKKASILGKAMQEIGTEFFYVVLLEECEMEHIDERERYWIDKMNTLYPNGYNVLYGAPYGHDEAVRTKISKGMKAFFEVDKVRKVYSESHMNAFKAIPADNIRSIQIRTIKQNNVNKLAYMYVIYEDGSKVRRRYGGIHEAYDDTYKRCYSDAQELVRGDIDKISCSSRIDSCSVEYSTSSVDSIELRLHKMQEHKLVAVYVVSSNGRASLKKRYVFGGKTIDVNDAFKSAMEFVNKIKRSDTKFDIKQNLYAATLSN